MPDTMEAVGKNMDQEAPDKLVGRQTHDLSLFASFDAVVLPAECHGAGISADQSAVRDRHPMSISAEIGKHGLRPSEWRFGIDDPVDLAERRHPFGEGNRVSQVTEFPKEVQFASSVESGQAFDKQATEQSR